MILSMTGFGSAQRTVDGISYALEIRSVNNRYLKLAIKLPERLQFAEVEVERILRGRVNRGTVTYTLRIKSQSGAAASLLNLAALQQYLDQLQKIKTAGGTSTTIDLAALALLPGVTDVGEMDEEFRARAISAITQVTNQALEAMLAMRREEGRVLMTDLSSSLNGIRREVETVQSRAPMVVDEYHDRLKTRVGMLMQKGGFELQADGLMREVAIFAERCDIGEEINRLTSHLDQFVELCERGEQVGRTLDFLTQELLREANTIGSKSNDAAIARSVVTVKGLIDRLKEQVQNVE
ncbi:MAG: YicC family protein [Planctomycetes bacterium]|nr:YicC family protein [Planctomycetota bacterium]MBI3834162.1 YicC family protein [Planctomycetota bacterium]